MENGFFSSRVEAEQWTALETRAVPIPDGSLKPITDWKLAWRSYDFIIEYGLFTTPELVRMALQCAEDNGEPVETSFANMVAYVQSEIRKSVGID